MRHRLTLGAGLIVGAGLIGGVTAGAAANIQSALYLAPDFWIYKIKYMPDFDQRRTGGELANGTFVPGLPGNGNWHCVPTSAINLMAYIGRHGFPEVPPGDVPYLQWMSQAKYNDATDVIDGMAGAMGTDPNGGTGGNDGLLGVNAWLFFGAYNQFDVDNWWLTGNFSPTLTEIGEAAVGGALVQLGYGSYNNAGQPFGLQALGARTGGHAVTFAHGSRFGNSQTLGVRDPADDPDSGTPYYKQTQSTFGNLYYDVTDLEVFWCINGDCSQPMTFLNYDPEGAKVYMIDGFLTVKPKAGYAFTPQNETIVYYPFVPAGWAMQPQTVIAGPAGAAVSEAVMAPDDATAFLYVGAVIIEQNLASGELEPFAELADVVDMTFGCNRQLYAATNGDLFCYNPALPQPFVGSASAPEDIGAIAFDDAKREVVGVSFTDYVLMFYPENLSGDVDPVMQDLPNGVDIIGEDGGLMIEPPVVGEKIWLYASGAPVVYGVRRGDETFFEEIQIPAGQIYGLDMDDSGRLFVSTEKGVLEFERDGGEWFMVPEEERLYADLPPCSKIQMSRSQNNYDPKLHEQEGWQVNIDPDELPTGTHVRDCDADLNNDGVVGAEDLADLLGAWGPVEAGAADFNGDDVVDAADLAILLGAWGPCP